MLLNGYEATLPLMLLKYLHNRKRASQDADHSQYVTL